MKRVEINAYQYGLVFKNGVYEKLLTEGVYWLFGANKSVIKYDITKPFAEPVELNILLADEAFAGKVEMIDVSDNELVLEYENGLLKSVLTAGRYVYFKSPVQRSFIKADISKIDITEPIDRATLTNRLVIPYVRTSAIESYEQGILSVDGKYVETLDSGVYYWWKNSTAVVVNKVDKRQQQADISGQEILTKDKAALRINAQAQYKVVDIEKALLQNKDYERQLYVLFQLALREYTGTYTLDELLEKKEAIAPLILQAVAGKAMDLGVELLGFGIRDIILPGDVKDIMNGVLIAEKKAQANSITRREETASTRSLLNTAKLMEDNAMLYKLKEMEYVEKIADKISSISVGSNGVLTDQLKQIFIPQK